MEEGEGLQVMKEEGEGLELWLLLEKVKLEDFRCFLPLELFPDGECVLCIHQPVCVCVCVCVCMSVRHY